MVNKILYPAKLYFKCEKKIKTLVDKQKIREFVTCPAKNVKRSPPGCQERTLNRNSKLYEESMVSPCLVWLSG